MARQIIDIGTIGNDGTGDSIRDSFRKVNENFRELYSSLGLGERLTFRNLSDTPDDYRDVSDIAVLTVNNSNDGLAFKNLVGEGISVDSSTNSINIRNLFTRMEDDPSPVLGGNLKAKSGEIQRTIVELPIYQKNQNPTGGPQEPSEVVSKSYVDAFVSLAGVEHIDSATNRVNQGFGRMTGPLILSRNPIAEDDENYLGLIAATKKYVDESTFGSRVNLYVSTSGADERSGIDSRLQGTSLSYAYRTIEAALKRAEDMMYDSRVELGPYKKTLTYSDLSGTSNVTLSAIVQSPNDGNGFSAKPLMSIDTISLNQPGANYYPNDIIDIVGGTGTAARIQVLSTNTTPGSIAAFKLISTGVYNDVLPGTNNVESELSESGAPANVTPNGVGATFNLTYKINRVQITNQGSGYGLVSVRISGGGGSGAFGTADVSDGQIVSITITDTGSGFTAIPTVIAELPRLCLFTDGLRTDSTGDPLSTSSEANRAKDLREGLYLRGETSGALAQILTHSGELGDIDGNPAEDQEVPSPADLYELFDVDIKYGIFEIGEEISFADITKNLQITVLVESGVYEENYPLKIPQNVALVGDEFRRAIVTPRSGMSTSPWVFQKFRRDLTIGADGKTFIREDVEDENLLEVDYNDVLSITNSNKPFAHHYLSDPTSPVVAKIQNKGSYDAAATLIRLNKSFIQAEIIAWIDYNIENNIAPFTELFVYDRDYCRRDVGLIIDSMIYDLKRGGYNRTVSAGLKYRQNASGLLAVTTQLEETLAAIARIDFLVQKILDNLTIADQDIKQDKSSAGYIRQVIDTAFQAEIGSKTVATQLNITLRTVIEEFDSSDSIINRPKNNNELDVFLCNDATIIRSLSAQGHGGFMMVLDPEGQILAKSPYAQECSSFSRSKNTQTFAGGQFVDGFSGNLQWTHVNSVYTVNTAVVETAGTDYEEDDILTVEGGDPTREATFRITSVNLAGGITGLRVEDEGFYYERLIGTVTLSGGSGSGAELELVWNVPTRIEVTGLDRFPQLPSSVVVNDEVYRINYVRNFDYDANGSSATFVLDETTPFDFPPGIQDCQFEFADDGETLVIVNSDHRLQRGATVIFSTTGSLPTGLTAGQEYYVVLEGLDDIRFRISDIPGSISPITVTNLGSGSHTYQRIYELITPGNRSMLGNDFTQVNDLGYGLIAANGGLIEAVSVFTYYCHISYYSINGGQIRSVSGSSAHGNYALVAQGSDPLEVPTPMGVYEDLSQGITCYFPNSDFANEADGFTIFATNYTYAPIGNSELEIDHDGEIFRYTVNSVTYYNNDPTTGIVRINLSGNEGLTAQVPDGTKMTIRNEGRLVVSGNVINVAVRPSTGLELEESPGKVYRVLQFNQYDDPNAPYICNISLGAPAVVTKVAHRQKPGYLVSFSASGGELPEPLIAGRSYYVIEDGFTENSFKISTVKNGTAISTTTAGSGTFSFTPRGLATARLRETYGYVLIVVKEPNEFRDSVDIPGFDPDTELPDFEFTTDPGPGATENDFIIDTGIAHGFVDGDIIRIILGTVEATGATIVGTTAIITFDAQNFAPFSIGQQITVDNFNPSGYNGNFTVTNCTTTQVTFEIPTGTPTGPAVVNGDVIARVGLLPSGLRLSSHYFVRNSTATTFKIAVSPAGAALKSLVGLGTGPFRVGKVRGIVGDDSFLINELAANDLENNRVIGSKFVWIGEEYIIEDYEPGVEGGARITLNRGLINGVVSYGTAITLRAAPPAGSFQLTGTLTVRISLTRATGHDLLDIGTGSYADTNYPNEIYGPSVNPPNPVEETQERGVGRVFYVTTDQFGNVSIGPFFKVDQGTGTVSINAPIAVSNLSGLGFKDGVTITEFSIETNLNNELQSRVPTEYAVKRYIDRRLGMDNNGNSFWSTENTAENVLPRPSDDYPGGFLPLNGQSSMLANINMQLPIWFKPLVENRFNKIINLDDPTNPRDAVNLQSLTIANIQGLDFDGLANNQLAVMTGATSGSSILTNAAVSGDVTFSNRIGNSIQTTISAGAINNSKVSATADIDQTKLSLNNTFATNAASIAIVTATGTGDVATLTFAAQTVVPFAAGQKIVVSGVTNTGYNGTYTVTASTTTSVSYENTTSAASANGTVSALRGIATFDQSQFSVNSGFVTIKNNGIELSKLVQISENHILGRGSGAGNVTAIPYSTVASTGGAVLTSMYTGTGFLRAGAAGSNFTVVNSSQGSAGSVGGNDLIRRSSDGDFGGRIIDVVELATNGVTVVKRTTASATAGNVKYNGFNTNRGITFSSTASTTTAEYNSATHTFMNGDQLAPIYASTAEISTLQATGGTNASAGEIIGSWTLKETSKLEATYAADLAEYYEADKEYSVGTVLVFGGDKEVTLSTTHADTRIAGVVSNTAAYVMYAACPGIKTLIALQGRVPCRVVGKISKGDLLVTSNIPGVAISARDTAKPGTIIGKALANFDSDHIGTIEVAVGRN